MAAWSLRSEDSRAGCPHMDPKLLRDHAAGDAIAGVARGVGLHVVGFGVDDDCSASIAEERVRAVAESYVAVFQARVGFAFHIDDEVVHVAGVVAFGILQAVLLALGIEMRPRGLEVGSVALGVLMKMDGVLAGRKIVKVKLEAYARPVLRQEYGAHGFALSVLEFDFGFGGTGESENQQGDTCG